MDRKKKKPIVVRIHTGQEASRLEQKIKEKIHMPRQRSTAPFSR